MPRNEKTSPKVGGDAARLVRMNRAQLVAFAVAHPDRLKAVAASAWTQMPDREA